MPRSHSAAARLTNRRVFDFIERPAALAEDAGERVATSCGEFQQFTGPGTAKGIEDTAFYIYNRLALAERGRRRPRTRSASRAEDFHARRTRTRQARGRTRCSATSTHDTKRSEDVRARINVLSETAGASGARGCASGARLNRRHRTLVDGEPAPRRERGVLPLPDAPRRLAGRAGADAEHAAFTERIAQYMLKAVKEAKVHASWIHPSPEYDAAIAASSPRSSIGRSRPRAHQDACAA